MASHYPLPPTSQRPRFRWWWPAGAADHASLERQLVDLSEAGFGGAEIANLALGSGRDTMSSDLMWGSTAWNDAVLVAYRKAAELGLQLDLTIGPLWPSMVPGLRPDDVGAAQELTYGTAQLEPGQRFTGTPPVPTTPSAGLSPANLDAVSTLHLLSVHAIPLSTRLPTESGAFTVARDCESTLVGVAQGVIDWTAPAGDRTFALVATYSRGTAQTKSSFEYNDTIFTDPLPGVVDHLGAEGVKAVSDYYESSLPTELRNLFRKVGGCLFEDSLELAQAQYWTPSFLQAFATQHGYDLLPHLPLVVQQKKKNFFTPSQLAFSDHPLQHRISHDFFSTVSTLYLKNRVEGLNAFAASLGLRFRNQPYGIPIDMVMSAYLVDIPEGETLCFGGNRDAFRFLATGRDVAGKVVLSTELAAVLFQDYQATWKWTIEQANEQFALGVNQIMLHGLPCDESPTSTWPGYFPLLPNPPIPSFSEAWGSRQPQWQFAGAAAAYLARASSILQRGKAVIDVAIYRSQLGLKGGYADEQLNGHGYSYGFPSDGLLQHSSAVVEGGRLWPQGPAYQAIIINNESSMPLKTARQLLAFGQSGLPILVVGEAPSTIPGFSATLEQDETDLRKTVTNIVQLSTTSSVQDAGDVPKALRSLGIEPSISYQQSTTGLVTARRSEDEADWFFIYGGGKESTTTEVTLPGGGRPSVINLWNGDIQLLPVLKQTATSATVRVKLEPGEAVVIRHDNSKVGDASALSPPATSSTAVNFSEWSLILEDWVPANPSAVGAGSFETRKTLLPAITLSDFRPWSELEGGLDVSGVGRYSATFTAAPQPHGRVELHIVRVSNGSYGVSINGSPVATDLLAHNAIDITKFVRSGTNEVVVTVASTLSNRLRTVMPDVYGKRERQAYGLQAEPTIRYFEV